jgi:hypothetical protein
MHAISRDKFYDLLRRGVLAAFKIGRRIYVAKEEAERWLRETQPRPAEVFDGRVYFIDDGFFIKIGFSKNPQDRIIKLQTASPFKLTLMRTVPGNKKLETELHARFRHLKSHGEWFRGERELRQHIREMS